jgi:hypothetical protein
MSPALQPAQSDHADTTSPSTTHMQSDHGGATQQQSAGMVHGTTPQENAYNQGQSAGESQNDANNASGGGRRRRTRRRTCRCCAKKGGKGKRSRRGRHSIKRRKSKRRKSKRHASRRARSRKSRKSRKGKKSMRGGSSACGAGYVMAEVGSTMYPDRSGGDQTVASQTTMAQSSGMEMDAQSKLDGNVPSPSS